MKVAFIHNAKRIHTGAHQINDLIANALRDRGVKVKNFYPSSQLLDPPNNLKGIASILFFYSLLEKRKEIGSFDLIQGTTYTPLPFISFDVPVICHFGSTTDGFLENTPNFSELPIGAKKIFNLLKKSKVIPEVELKTKKPLRDVSDMEIYVAKRATAVVATSLKVQEELLKNGVPLRKISVIYNSIEDYWFEGQTTDYEIPDIPTLVYWGRLGNDVFTWNLKGLDRLIHLSQRFPDLPKMFILMTVNKGIGKWLNSNLKNAFIHLNTIKDEIKNYVGPLRGGIFFLTSRYEGFSLSLIEAMSQGLVPISYNVGVAPEIIKNGINGFLVNDQDEAMAAVKTLLRDKQLRKTMSINAITTSQRFKTEFMVNRLYALYQKVLGY